MGTSLGTVIINLQQEGGQTAGDGPGQGGGLLSQQGRLGPHGGGGGHGPGGLVAPGGCQGQPGDHSCHQHQPCLYRRPVPVRELVTEIFIYQYLYNSESELVVVILIKFYNKIYDYITTGLW